VKIQKKVFKGVTKLAKKAWKNKYIRAGLIIAAIATGVGAFAAAGATGTSFGAALSAGFSSPSAFGAMMKAGFVGFAPGAAGTLGAGGSAGALGASLVGPTAGTTGLLGGGGAFLSGGSLLTGTSLVPGSTASVTSTLIPASVKGKVGVVSASTGGTTGAAVPFSATTFGGVGGLIPTTTAVSAGGAALGTPAASAAITHAVKASATSAGKSGFLGTIKNTLKDGIYSGVKNLAAQGTYNLLMHGDIKGPDFEQDIPYVSGNSSGYYSGTYALPDAIKFTNTNLGSDTIGSTYVNMLKNLNYGTGSLDYARHTNMALMRGIQVPPIQYA